MQRQLVMRQLQQAIAFNFGPVQPKRNGGRVKGCSRIWKRPHTKLHAPLSVNRLSAALCDLGQLDVPGVGFRVKSSSRQKSFYSGNCRLNFHSLTVSCCLVVVLSLRILRIRRRITGWTQRNAPAENRPRLRGEGK